LLGLLPSSTRLDISGEVKIGRDTVLVGKALTRTDWGGRI